MVELMIVLFLILVIATPLMTLALVKQKAFRVEYEVHNGGYVKYGNSGEVLVS
jgi:hypothetical protein